jgi:transposase-like protein
MEAELDHHLGYERGQEPPPEQTNRRNGKRSKRLRTEQGDLQVDVPRDRDGSFEPQLVPLTTTCTGRSRAGTSS